MNQLGLFNDVSQIPELVRQIKELESRIYDIQKECVHPPDALTKKAKSDTGNWCVSDDRYWYECKCSLCGKWWTEDQ
jgi:hypothetical protein